MLSPHCWQTAERRGWRLSEKSIGIIGVGRIGTLVARKAAALGMKVLLCDPPLRESTGDERYGFLDDVLGADILTLHVPLTVEGPYPTLHMVNSNCCGACRPASSSSIQPAALLSVGRICWLRCESAGSRDRSWMYGRGSQGSIATFWIWWISARRT